MPSVVLWRFPQLGACRCAPGPSACHPLRTSSPYISQKSKRTAHWIRVLPRYLYIRRVTPFSVSLFSVCWAPYISIFTPEEVVWKSPPSPHTLVTSGVNPLKVPAFAHLRLSKLILPLPVARLRQESVLPGLHAASRLALRLSLRPSSISPAICLG